LLNSLEMLVHVPLATHKEPNSILVVTDREDNIRDELKRHKFLNLETKFFSTLDSIRDLESEKFDIAIFDLPIESSVVMSVHLKRVLKSDGLASTRGDFQTLKAISSEFRIAMPYLVNSLTKSSEVLILASKFYHPTADINLQRADFIDGCNYYNSDIHTASFIMPNYIKREIREFVKN